jgi:hypothetical protein
MATMQKLFYCFLVHCLYFAGQSYGMETTGALRKIETTDSDKLSFECRFYAGVEKVKINVSLQKSNSFMEVELDGGIRVRGFSSETLDRKTGTTYYFLQGGSAPYFQQLTLSIRNGGDWAELKQTYGGDSIRCVL